MHLKRMCIMFFWDITCPEISIKSNCTIVSFRISVALLIFCLDDLSIDVSWVLKSAHIIVLPQISPFMSVNIYVMYLGSPILSVLGSLILHLWQKVKRN